MLLQLHNSQDLGAPKRIDCLDTDQFWRKQQFDISEGLLLLSAFPSWWDIFLVFKTRIFADLSVCHGGQVDSFGMCICPSRYTGEYCWDRVCAPGATLSYGICSCSSGFYGDFCELELMMPNTTTAVPTLSSTSNPLQTTTKLSFSLSGFSTVLLFSIVHVLFL